MYVWSSLQPRSYLRHRSLAITVLRLFVFCMPVITALPPFDATISAPSSIPFVGWAVDTFMMFVGGWLPLADSAPLLLQVPLHASAALRAHLCRAAHPACCLCSGPHQKCCSGPVPFLALQPAAPG